MKPAADALDDRTVSAPLAVLEQAGQRLVALTVLWHPDRALVGARAVLTQPREPWLVNRHTPLFAPVGGGPARPLDAATISRSPLVLEAGPGGVRLHAPDSRVPCLMAGQPLVAEGGLEDSAIDAGVVLQLGSQVLLCLHWLDTLPEPAVPSPALAALVGRSSAMVRVRRQIALVAPTAVPVLVLGESGTGKELVAQAIHATSARGSRPLVALNMAALTDSLAAADLFGSARGAYTGAQTARRGAWAEADGGTLFLDEVGDTPRSVQPMLLRVIETGCYRPLGASREESADVRLVAATDRNLEAEAFNQPLLRRLEGVVIRMPPLRERREDIGLLVLHQMRGDIEGEVPLALVHALCLHDWPGNVRQLGHAVQRVVLASRSGSWPSVGELLGSAPRTSAATSAGLTGVAPAPSPVDTPPVPASNPRYRAPASVDPAELLQALDNSAWCLRTAAAQLGISRPSLYNLLERHPQVRWSQDIERREVEALLREPGVGLDDLARRLRTPRDALRRKLKDWSLG